MSRQAVKGRRFPFRGRSVQWLALLAGLGVVVAGGVFSGIPAQLATAALGTPCTDTKGTLAPVARVNLGGPSVIAGGESWSGDPSLQGGSAPPATDGAVDGTRLAPLYRTAHVGDFSYRVPVPGEGQYLVTLYFAETAPGVGSQHHRRVFSVDVENGQARLRNFNVAAVAGGRMRAVQKSFSVRVTDGWLDLAGTGVLGQPILNAVQVQRQLPGAGCGGSSPTPPSPSRSSSADEQPTTAAPQPSNQPSTPPSATAAQPLTQATRSPVAPQALPSVPGSPSSSKSAAPTPAALPPSSTADAAGPLIASSGRPFSPTSAWNRPLPANPALNPRSATMVSALASSGKATANLYEFGDPVFTADQNSPTATVTCTQNWGVCDLQAHPMRIPPTAAPTTGSDGRMIVVDLVSRTSCDYWQARKVSANRWTASWGTCASLDGDGRGPNGGATGAGVNTLTGVIRTFELRNGQIPHALSVATGNSCSGSFLYPATKSDGSSSRSDCIPEGARLQLDPSVNVDALPDITPGERAVAHALQAYGAINRDNCGSNICVSFQAPIGEPDPYPAAGMQGDYYTMPHIPWGKLRVVQG